MSGYHRNDSYASGDMLRLGGMMTPAVKWLIIANSIVFIFELILGDSVQGFIRFFGAVPQLFWESLYFWQLFTYMFVHSPLDPFHILLNMLILWMFGITFERLWGTRRFLIFYFVGGLAGGLAVVLLSGVSGTMSNIPTIGASGAIYALIMAFGVWFPERNVYIYFFIPVKAKWLVRFIILITVLMAITGSNPGVSYAAHGGGLLAGYIMTSGIYKPRVLGGKLKWFYWKLQELYYRARLRLERRRRRHIRRVDDDDKPEMYH